MILYTSIIKSASLPSLHSLRFYFKFKTPCLVLDLFVTFVDDFANSIRNMSFLTSLLYGYCSIGFCVLVYFIYFTRQRHKNGFFAVPRVSALSKLKNSSFFQRELANYTKSVKIERAKFAAMSPEEKARDLFPDLDFSKKEE